MSEPYMGQITMYGFNWAVRGWANCDGQLQSIAQNSALFSLLGTTYGGDGRTTFGLPDMRSRVAVHQGTGPGLSNYRLGQRGGEETHTLNTLEMPNHDHSSAVTTKVVAFQGSADSPANAYPATITGGYATSGPAPTIAAFAPDQTTVQIGMSGGSQPHNNIQPYLVVNYQIALQGLYPSRS